MDGHIAAASHSLRLPHGPDSLLGTRMMPKGCYTCRRRRIVCDNGRPTCRKCRDAGKECLGYQKPLVWVKGGVASRGKMMGLSFDDVTTADQGKPNLGFYSPASSEKHSGRERTEQGRRESETPPNGESMQIQVQTLSEATLAKYYNNDGMLVHVRQLPPESPSFSLVDPLFKDLDKLSRLYISHCKTTYGVLFFYINNAKEVPLVD